MSGRFHSNKYSFIRFDNLSGFNAFENGESVGIDEVCKYIDKLEQQLEEANDKIEEINNYLPKIGESSYAMMVKQLKEAENVIDYYLPILEERLACGAYARQYKKKWSDK
jgi:hypothetical protein